jgi:hypothetical protein
MTLISLNVKFHIVSLDMQLHLEQSLRSSYPIALWRPEASWVTFSAAPGTFSRKTVEAWYRYKTPKMSGSNQKLDGDVPEYLVMSDQHLSLVNFIGRPSLQDTRTTLNLPNIMIVTVNLA